MPEVVVADDSAHDAARHVRERIVVDRTMSAYMSGQLGYRDSLIAVRIATLPDNMPFAADRTVVGGAELDIVFVPQVIEIRLNALAFEIEHRVAWRVPVVPFAEYDARAFAAAASPPERTRQEIHVLRTEHSGCDRAVRMEMYSNLVDGLVRPADESDGFSGHLTRGIHGSVVRYE